jgi:hypothetical protein
MIFRVGGADPNYQMLNAVAASRQGWVHAGMVTMASSFQQQLVLAATDGTEKLF